MKIQKHLPSIGTAMPIFYPWITGLYFLFLIPGVPQGKHTPSHIPTTQSFVGIWKVYFVEADHSLTFSHNEEYKANHEFSQWNANFSVTGRWWSEENKLFVRFDFPAKTICGHIEFQGDNTFYYLEVGYPRSELLVNKRQIPAQKSTVAKPKQATSTLPTSSPAKSATKSNSIGFEEYVEREMCINCYDTGGDLCGRCFGSGKITKEETKYEYGKTTNRTVEYSCSSCEGKGRRRCVICDGRGYIERKKMRLKQH